MRIQIQSDLIFCCESHSHMNHSTTNYYRASQQREFLAKNFGSIVLLGTCLHCGQKLPKIQFIKFHVLKMLIKSVYCYLFLVFRSVDCRWNNWRSCWCHFCVGNICKWWLPTWFFYLCIWFCSGMLYKNWFDPFWIW